jgi:hypothetical protein
MPSVIGRHSWEAERRGLSSPSLGTGMQRQPSSTGYRHAHDRLCTGLAAQRRAAVRAMQEA